MPNKPTFRDDLALQLEDPEFYADFMLQSIRIRAFDSIMNTLEDARIEAGISKAQLARLIDMNPAQVRRSLTSAQNLTLKSVNDMATVLGLKLALVPIEPADIERVNKITSSLKTKTRQVKNSTLASNS
jgi:DNA-binding phage protein